MKISRILIVLMLLPFVVGCGIPQEYFDDIAKLKDQRDALYEKLVMLQAKIEAGETVDAAEVGSVIKDVKDLEGKIVDLAEKARDESGVPVWVLELMGVAQLLITGGAFKVGHGRGKRAANGGT